MKQNSSERRNTSRKIKSMRENTERDRQAWKATLYALGKSYSLMRNKERLLFIDTMATNSLEKAKKEIQPGRKRTVLPPSKVHRSPFHKVKYCNSQLIENYSIYKNGTDGQRTIGRTCTSSLSKNFFLGEVISSFTVTTQVRWGLAKGRQSR